MTAARITTLASALRGFFTQHLPQVRGASPHTVRSYRDSLALLLRFAATHSGQSVVQLDLDGVTSDVVIGFLLDGEQARRNRSSTRNVRLAAVHAFFRFVGSVHPEHLEQCQRVLAIPFKRSAARVVEYLEVHEIQAALLTIDRTTRDGRRDYTLLATMFNTGGRVQEILDLCPSSLQLISPAHVHLHGKECHAYCISFRRRDKTTRTHAGWQACDLAFFLADVLQAVDRGIGVGPYTDALGAARVAPMSEPWAA